jgi:hypothetical protein
MKLTLKILGGKLKMGAGQESPLIFLSFKELIVVVKLFL